MRIPAGVARKDCLFLVLMLACSFGLHVGRLGFYSDDWAFLSALSHATDQSLGGLFDALYVDENVRPRPVQALHLAWMFALFGTSTPGYHLVNGVVLTGAVLLFYLALRELGLPRIVALAIPLSYGLLPNFTGARFWVAASQAPLSMALYFASLYLDLRAVRSPALPSPALPSPALSPAPPSWWLKSLAIACMIASVLAYEVALPLFLLNVAVVVAHRQRLVRGAGTRLGVMALAHVLVLVSLVAYKAMATAHAGEVRTDHLTHILGLARHAVVVDVLQLGVFLLPNTAHAARAYPDAGMVAGACIVGVAIAVYLYRADDGLSPHARRARLWGALLVLGPAVYGLGYAVFASTTRVMFHPTGLSNRIGIAASIGVAITVAAGVGLLAVALPTPRARRLAFASGMALFCACGFLLLNVNAGRWVAASREQRRVLASLQAALPTLPPGSTLMVDGVCPYIGSGVVFEGYWDVAGAIQLAYDDPGLLGDLVTPKLVVGERTLTTFLYEEPKQYRYAASLLLYDARSRTVHRLGDAATARAYFDATARDRPPCPRGVEGEGVPLF